jgi:ferredoxin-like protein FixX
VPADLKDVRAIYSTLGAFAALKEDGTVQAWGNSGYGGSGVPADLKDVRAIYSTLGAFAALKEDGTVQAWGSSGYGGSGVPADLKDVRAIYSTGYAFAALTGDGTVQAWGNPGHGGSGVPTDLTDVRAIYSTGHAFAALTGDGTVQAWGNSNRGGSVPDGLKNVKSIFGTTSYYADSTSAHHYPCPHHTYGSGFPNCTTCPSGTNQPRGRPGIRSSIGSCIECNPGRYSTDGTSCSKSCLPRSLNLSSYNWFDGKEFCLPCVLGKHLNVNISRSECTTCPAGRYRGSEGQVSCTECSAGQYAVEGSPQMFSV